MKGSGLYVKRWNTTSMRWELKELPKRKKVKFSWRVVGLLVSFVLGIFVGFLV
jgi:hypothetical protein